MQTLSQWGIQTLGGLAELPEVDLIARLGQECKSSVAARQTRANTHTLSYRGALCSWKISSNLLCQWRRWNAFYFPVISMLESPVLKDTNQSDGFTMERFTATSAAHIRPQFQSKGAKSTREHRSAEWE